MKFDTPLKVTEDTISFEMQFTTSRSVSVDFHGNNDMQTIKVGANPFGVKFVLGNK